MNRTLIGDHMMTTLTKELEDKSYAGIDFF